MCWDPYILSGCIVGAVYTNVSSMAHCFASEIDTTIAHRICTFAWAMRRIYPKLSLSIAIIVTSAVFKLEIKALAIRKPSQQQKRTRHN